MIDDFLKVSDERGRAHFKVLVNFFTDPEEPDRDSSVELNEMRKKCLDNLLSVGV